MVFFVLSGYLIHSSYDGDLKRYIKARLWRIYPVFLAALLVTYVTACVAAGRVITVDLAHLAGNLAMLQDRPREGSIVSPFMGNEALWSLSYEVAFYAIYPLVMRCRTPTLAAILVAAAGFALMIAAPSQLARFAAYFALWWLGAALWEHHKGRAWPLVATSAAVSAGVIALLLVGSAQLEARHFAGALAGCLVVGSSATLAPALRPFAPFAPTSYALYALHFPLLASAPLLPLPLWAGLTVMASTAYCLAWVVELYAHRLKKVRAPFERDFAAFRAAGQLPNGIFLHLQGERGSRSRGPAEGV